MQASRETTTGPVVGVIISLPVSSDAGTLCLQPLRSRIANMATVTVPTPNVVVTLIPDPPRLNPNYPSKSSFALGGIQIGVGFLLSLVSLVVLPNNCMKGMIAHLLFGVIYIVAGTFGIVAGRVKTTCHIVSFMALSTIAYIYAVLNVIAYSVSSVTVTVVVAGQPCAHVIIIAVRIFIVVFLVEAIASIWSAAICYRCVCCGCRENPEVVLKYEVPNGQVTVTVNSDNLSCPDISSDLSTKYY
ncbi:hypothetical protein LSAT2_011161 [Lamellibrachia satsuma]|nr:hypothetical protein LSAT2_011161 [Lamellibrachia satsuma]